MYPRYSRQVVHSLSKFCPLERTVSRMKEVYTLVLSALGVPADKQKSIDGVALLFWLT